MVVVAAAQGLAWIREGWRLVRVKPIVWMAMVFAYWMLMSLLGSVPYAGVACGLVLVPVFSMSFMNVARAAERGEKLEFSLLFSGFRRELPSLLKLGGVYLGALVLVLAVTQFLDGGVLMRGMLLGQPIGGEALHGDALRHASLAAIFLTLPVMAAFWFAPMLVAWHGMASVKSIFYSFFAALANWRAFLAYGAGLAVLAGLLPGLVIAVLVMVVEPASRLLPYLMAAFFALIVPVAYASFYASYRSVFPTQADAPLPASNAPRE